MEELNNIPKNDFKVPKDYFVLKQQELQKVKFKSSRPLRKVVMPLLVAASLLLFIINWYHSKDTYQTSQLESWADVIQEEDLLMYDISEDDQYAFEQEIWHDISTEEIEEVLLQENIELELIKDELYY